MPHITKGNQGDILYQFPGRATIISNTYNRSGFRKDLFQSSESLLGPTFHPAVTTYYIGKTTTSAKNYNPNIIYPFCNKFLPQIMKFFCGIYTPVFSKLKIKKLPYFSIFEKHPFLEVKSWIEDNHTT